ncbi:MAG: phytanoyl-CoA dioxygenase family protein [Acidimicrobiia bacterium]
MDRPTEDHLADIERDGYTIVHNAFPPELADALVAELERLERELAVVPAGNSFEGSATWRIYNLLARGERFREVPLHPGVLPIVEGVLDAGCLVSSLSSIAIGPGEVAQPIHADDALHPIARPHAATVCNSMWALTDFTEDNGATRVVPGSHLADHTPPYGERPVSVPAEMAKGSILVWHGSLWHGGGANRTDRRRYGLAMNYCAGWIRQQENQQLGIPLDALATFPPRLLELCGLGIYKGLVGHVERRTPSEHVLGEDRIARPMLWDKVG